MLSYYMLYIERVGNGEIKAFRSVELICYIAGLGRQSPSGDAIDMVALCVRVCTYYVLSTFRRGVCRTP